MKTKKILRKSFALCCATLMGFSVISCKGGNDENSRYASLGDVEFWGTYSTEKVLQDNVEIYDDIKQAAVLNVSAIGGEEEAAQIIMTANDKAVKEYDVILSDLSGDNGATFSKDNIKVYHERYIYVGAASEYYRTAGYFPDCLVPFENVKKVGETGFKANNNQGLYVSFDIPEEQASGTYTGNMQVVIDGESKQIPITLKVVNGSITAETHVQSAFLNEWYFYRGELDTTDEMYEKYNQKLFEYRLGCNKVVLYHSKSLDLYAETVCRYAKQIECPGYNIPYFTKNYENSGYILNGRELNCSTSYDVDKMLLWLKTIAYKGLEENVDPFKKAFIYGWDEPDLTFGVDKAAVFVKEWSYIVKQCKEMVIEELRADGSIEDQELLEQICVSLAELPHLVLSSTFLNNNIDLEEEAIVYCPEFQHLQGEGQRDTYRLGEDNDLWWYGCVEPDYPYPTYHIDDTVLSARLESWMKANYNIQGNLYWSTCLYSEPKNSAEAGELYPEDFYSGNAARTLATNGEGFLFYPGKKYGIDGPLSSIRLEQIRDGLEEYEMLYKMREIYSSVGDGYTEEGIMQYLYDNLYTGTKVGTSSANFEKMRSLLLNLFELACSKANVCITKADMVSGKTEINVYANDGYTVKQGDVEITNKTPVNGGNLYTISLGAEEALNLSVDIDGKSYGFAMKFATSSSFYDAQYLLTNNVARKRNETSALNSTSIVNATAVANGWSSYPANEQWLKLDFNASVDVKQDCLLVDDSFKTLHQTADKLVLRIFVAPDYNDLKKKIPMELLIQYGNNTRTYISYETLQLKAGENIITIGNIGAMKWSELKYINALRLSFGEVGDGARSVYLMDMGIYKL